LEQRGCARRPWRAAATVVCALLGAAAGAAEFEGYVRVGSGDADKADRTCYNLGISGGHYRLGNECDLYGEFGVAHTVVTSGASYRGHAMVNAQRPGDDGDGSSGGIEQLDVEAHGFAFAPAVKFWLGKRFFGRAGVHILDTWFVRMDGAGLGAHHIALGDAKLGVAFFRLEATAGAPFGTQPSERPARRFNVDLSEIPLGDGGRLRLSTTFTRGHDDAGASGTRGSGLSVQHDRAWPAIGGTNTAWLQVAQGSAGLDANFGTMTAATSVKQWRVVESLTWQSGALGGQAVALYGRHGRDAAHGIAAPYAEVSIGARVSYGVTDHLKLVGEAGHMRKRPDGADTQRLDKLTFAPTWSVGPGFWDRPELRLYVTWARWNDAANAAAGAGGLTGLADGATRGTSLGVQLEGWF
jgi:maltoporin